MLRWSRTFLFISIVALCGNQTFGQAGVQAAIEEVGQRNMLRLRYPDASRAR